ncbi:MULTISPECIES: DNA-binding protein [Methylocaldum]|uniref:DNA-binding protein n=1 Tax=Methylocaldum sp. GT1TLB TaxID=3438965 RepID=UPI0012EB9AE2|nr:DNA-binding protein [Methylocaldum sp. BRCS4]
MDLQERLKALIDHAEFTPTELERKTGIDRMRWSNIKRQHVRAGAPEIEAVGNLWPQYAYWLVIGLMQPEAGHISPEIEETRRNLKGAG